MQYGTERMVERGEEFVVRERHLHWCMLTAARLQTHGETAAASIEVAGDLSAGLGWAAGQRDQRNATHKLAMRLAELSFARGLPSEAQLAVGGRGRVVARGDSRLVDHHARRLARWRGRRRADVVNEAAASWLWRRRRRTRRQCRPLTPKGTIAGSSAHATPSSGPLLGVDAVT